MEEINKKKENVFPPTYLCVQQHVYMYKQRCAGAS